MPTAGLPSVGIPALNGVSIHDDLTYAMARGDTPRVQAWDFLFKIATLHEQMRDREMQNGIKLLTLAQHERELQTELEQNQQGYDAVRALHLRELGYDLPSGDKGHYEATKWVTEKELGLKQSRYEQGQQNYRAGLTHDDAKDDRILKVAMEADRIFGAQLAAAPTVDDAVEMIVKNAGSFRSAKELQNSIYFAQDSRFAATGKKDPQYALGIFAGLPIDLEQIMPTVMPAEWGPKTATTESYFDNNRLQMAALKEDEKELKTPRSPESPDAPDWVEYKAKQRATRVKRLALESGYWGWIDKNPKYEGTRPQYRLDYAKRAKEAVGLGRAEPQGQKPGVVKAALDYVKRGGVLGVAKDVATKAQQASLDKLLSVAGYTRADYDAAIAGDATHPPKTDAEIRAFLRGKAKTSR